MERRQFLAATVGVASVSGCVASSASKQPEGRGNDVSPAVNTVAVLSEWHERGDVDDEQTETIAPGDPAIVGIDFDLVCSDDREMKWRRTTLIHDSEGEVVSSHMDTYEDFSNGCDGGDLADWEQPMWMYYEGESESEWPTGEYTAEVTVDDYYGKASASGRASFTVEAE